MGLFRKKKRGTIDFTKMSDAQFPQINKDYKLYGDAVDLRQPNLSSGSSGKSANSPVLTSSDNSISSGGGLFGFLNSDDTKTSNQTTYPQRNVITEVSEISELKTTMRKLSSQIEDRGNEVYRLMQRIELLEKKIQRLEGR